MTKTDHAIALMAAALDCSPSEIPEDAAIGSFDAWDSLAHLRLILSIERFLGRELDPASAVAVVDLPSIRTLLANCR
jgi:acyl carrier protein